MPRPPSLTATAREPARCRPKKDQIIAAHSVRSLTGPVVADGAGIAAGLPNLANTAFRYFSRMSYFRHYIMKKTLRRELFSLLVASPSPLPHVQSVLRSPPPAAPRRFV